MTLRCRLMGHRWVQQTDGMKFCIRCWPAGVPHSVKKALVDLDKAIAKAVALGKAPDDAVFHWEPPRAIKGRGD